MNKSHPQTGRVAPIRKLTHRRGALVAFLAAASLILSSASVSALLVGDDGLFEPVFVQIKDSLRTSTDLDARLAALATLEKENGLSEVEWYAGPKLLVKLSFPKGFTEDEAPECDRGSPEIRGGGQGRRPVTANLEFKSADFARVWKAGETIPDESRRGFDVDRLNRSPITYDEKTELAAHVENQIIVRWKDEYVWNGGQEGFNQQAAAFNGQAGCAVVNEFTYTDHDLTQVLEFDSTKYSVLDQLVLYQTNEMVDYVQPDYIYETTAIPNDPNYTTYQWALPKISMPSAWDIQKGNGSIVAAILDTRANINHREFSPNLNSYHYDYANNDSDVTDFSPYHGSNVTSIVGAQGNNALYGTGVAWDVSLLILKVFRSLYPHETSTSILMSAMNSAQTNGASVMNLSLGNTLCTRQVCVEGVCDCVEWSLDTSLETSIASARVHNIVAVCAAGNDGNDNDSIPFAPSGLPEDNVISVAASDANDAPALFTSGGSSNAGVKTVDLAAPGSNIYGVTQNDDGSYVPFEGTSQAAPHVTGAIALLKSSYAWENYFGLRDRVLMATDDVAAWVGAVRTRGRLNVKRALHARTLIRNLSTRARVENNDRIMIGGFVVGGSGTGTLKLAFRGLGPSLDPFITTTVLPNPKLTLKNSSGATIASNDDWINMPAGQKTDFMNAGLDDFNGGSISSVESGIVWTLAPGAYSVWLESNNGTSFGVGELEIYELENGLDQQTRLLNVSMRCLVRTGEEIAIAGVTLGDPTHSTDTTLPKRSLLMFGKGPSLGISGYLANPFLALYNSTGSQMSTNDSWSTATASVVKRTDGTWSNVAAPVDELTPAGFNPSSSLESALWPILKSGQYTVQLTGVSNGTGIGLIEMYEH